MRVGRGATGIVVTALAALLLVACGDEPNAHSAGATGSGVASPGAFTTDGLPPADTTPGGTAGEEDPVAIVTRLWNRRQAGMLTEDAAVFRRLDAAPLAAHDLSIARLVACGCDVPRTQSPLDRIVVLKSRKPPAGLVFAEVFTKAPGQRTRFLAVAAQVKRSWRLAFVAYDLYDEQGARRFIDPTADAPATTAADRRDGAAILQREVAEAARWQRTGQPMSPIFTGNAIHSRLLPGKRNGNHARTDYGADAVSTLELHRSDPIFTFRLDSKRVLTCGAWHSPVQTFAPKGQVLIQPADKKAWGPDLAAGSYDSVTIDVQTLTCVLDHGSTAKPRYEGVGDYHAIVSVTGRPAT